jgi:hypothetical protein
MFNTEKKKDRLIELIEKYNQKNQDQQFVGLDVSLDTSLFEYGILLHEDKKEYSKTSGNEYFIIYCLDHSQYEDSENIKFDYTRITQNELIDTLKDIEKGFYDFTGQNKRKMIKQIKNNNVYCIVDTIHAINQYNGLYNEQCYFNETIDDYINYFKNLLKGQS